MWADAQPEYLMAAQPNIGCALCESSVIPFIVSRRKVGLTPAAGVPCSNAANIGEFILHQTKFRQGAGAPENVYIVYQPRRRPNTVQVWLASGERRR